MQQYETWHVDQDNIPVEAQEDPANSLPSTRVESGQLSGPPHPPKLKYSPKVKYSVLKLLIAGPLHPPKVKYQRIYQNVNTTSHRKIKKLTSSTEGYIVSPRTTGVYFIQAKTPQDLPGSREYPIFHEPGSITVNSTEDLLKLYPISFDRLGSLKGEYDIKVDLVCHQYSMQGGRCQLNPRQQSKRPLTIW